MIKVIKLDNPSDSNFCLCGKVATELRVDEDFMDEDFFCADCAKAADYITPEDLI